MAIFYHEVRESVHILKDRNGEEIFRGEEHALITRTVMRSEDRYMTYREQKEMSLPEFLEYLRELRKHACSSMPQASIPGQRRSGEPRRRGRSVD